jgi:hypothetical protein
MMAVVWPAAKQAASVHRPAHADEGEAQPGQAVGQ